MIFKDAPGVAKAYPVERIINLITRSWNHEWQMKLYNVSQEIHFGGGALTWQSELSDYISFGRGVNDPTDYNIESTGAICFGYRRYFLYKKIALGATVVIENHEARHLFKTYFRSNGVYFMLEGRYYYIHKRRFQLYSGFSPGIAKVTIKDTSYSKSLSEFAFQANLIGFVLVEKLVFFGEGGVGYKGAYNFGIAARF